MPALAGGVDFSHEDGWAMHPHAVGRNSAAPFPAKAEHSAQAPFLPPLPTGTALLTFRRGPHRVSCWQKDGPGERAAGYPQGVRRRKRQSRQRQMRCGGPYRVIY